jgi:hypothetical protein
MRRTRTLLAICLGALAVGPATTTAPATASAIAARSCHRGYVHAVINGSQKCLRAGEFCTHSADRQYRRYGFRCTRYYRNVGRYRLTHG